MERLEAVRKEVLALKPPRTLKNTPITRTPRTTSEVEDLISKKPNGWEYLLFGGVLYSKKDALEMKWHDFDMHYGKQNGSYFNNQEGVEYHLKKWRDLAPAIEGAAKALSDEAREKAFGPEGVPGDRNRIIHIATRIIDSYEQILDWAADLRGAGVSDDLRILFEAAAECARQPLTEFRSFIDKMVLQFDAIPAYLSDTSENKAPLNISSELSLTTDDIALKKFSLLMKKTRKKLKLR